MITDGTLVAGVRSSHEGTGLRMLLAAALALISLLLLTVALHAPVAAPAGDRALDDYAKLPLSFVPNRGQADARVRYYAQGPGYAFQFTKAKPVLSFTRGKRGVALELTPLGASPDARLVAGNRAPGRVNYLVGHERHANLPTYGEVTYRDLWPGIDMVFRGRGGKLEYEFHVAPGADPSRIRLAYRGAEGLKRGPTGDLLVETPLGTLHDARPVSYQNIGGERVPVASRYAVGKGASSYGFTVGRHDPGRPLVIDPSLAYSTFLGGIDFDAAQGVAVDATGNAYVTGYTFSFNFPTTPGAYDTTPPQLDDRDAFVTKFDPSGSSLVYSTYLGGFQNSDEGTGIAVDSGGNAYVAGHTQSTDFPTTAGAFDTSPNGSRDAFFAKLNAAGSTLVYSTYLGGTGIDNGYGIALDGGGNAYVTGSTGSTDFPTTAGAFDTSYNGGVDDVFVTKVNPTAAAPLAYSTYLGGGSFDEGYAIAVDGSGSAYVTGTTGSINLPTTAGAADTSANGNDDGFVTKLSATGSAPLAYSTYLGGVGFEAGRGIAVDGSGSAYVTGFTTSGDFPASAGAFDTTYNGGSDVFVTKMAAGLGTIVYSTFLGGTGDDNGRGVGVDASGNAHLGGYTTSSDFPTTPTGYDTSANGSTDAFVTKMNPTATALLYSTYLGGTAFEEGDALAVDAGGGDYVAGYTRSADFPTTAVAYDTTFNGLGGTDGFVTKLFPAGDPATITLEPPTATNPVGTQHCVTATVRDAIGSPVPGVRVRFSVAGANPGPESPPRTDANGQATFCYTGNNTGADTINAFADTNGNAIQDPGEPSSSAAKTWIPAVVPLDHFKTYEIGDGKPKFQKRTVTLADQFGSSQVSVGDPAWLLNPVNKNNEGVNSPAAHLKCYSIEDKKKFKEQKLALDNQFGSQTIKLEKPKTLCLPASKGAPNTDPGAPPTGLDHFKCYGTDSGKPKIKRTVTLTDQFVSNDQVTTDDVEYVCTPASKNAEPVPDPDHYLVCYELEKLDKFTKRKVSLHDQFGVQTVEAKAPKLLCVPSTKHGSQTQ